MRHSPPNAGLQQPLQKFADTFSAEAVVLRAYFPDVVRLDAKGRAAAILAGRSGLAESSDLAVVRNYDGPVIAGNK